MRAPKYDSVAALQAAGISYQDATALRRISMTLHKWHEMECGDSNEYVSTVISRGYETNKPGHWHKYNPWADNLVYVPLVELAHCVAGGTIDVGGKVVPFDFEYVLNHWRSNGRTKLDGYILPQPGIGDSIGVRYGSKPEAYFSPHNAHPDKTADLLARYRDWKPVRGFMHDDDGKPFLECRDNKDGRVAYFPIADKERGALKRLAAIMARYPSLGFYVQGDPRGASLYILRPGDVPEGATADSCYSRGIVVCQ